MIWQDIVITVASISFSVGLIPAVLKRDKPPVVTSLITFLGMLGITICYISFNLVLSTITGSITTILWLVLFIQKVSKE